MDTTLPWIRLSTSGILFATLFMAQLAPLVPHIPEAKRANFLAHTLEALYRHATHWHHPKHSELCADYLQ